MVLQEVGERGDLVRKDRRTGRVQPSPAACPCWWLAGARRLSGTHGDKTRVAGQEGARGGAG